MPVQTGIQYCSFLDSGWAHAGMTVVVFPSVLRFQTSDLRLLFSEMTFP